MASTIDWTRVERLRRAFLAAEERPGRAAATPWRDAEDVRVYDLTLGARIGWKWQAVLDELGRSGFQPPAGVLVDWGCGSGVASRAVLGAWPGWTPERLGLWDRSRPALDHAAARAREQRPELRVDCGPPDSEAPGLLLVSHVLNELDGPALEQLTQLALSAQAVVWVESGSRTTSRALSGVRERLREELTVVAPCPHRGACGVLSAGNEDEWCHHFAHPPAVAFQSAHWTEFSQRLGVDLRALSYSYICLARAELAPALGALEGSARVLGRPHIQKGRLTLHACDAAGVRVLELWKRDDKALFKAFGDVTRTRQRYRFELDGDRIRAGEPLPLQGTSEPSE